MRDGETQTQKPKTQRERVRKKSGEIIKKWKTSLNRQTERKKIQQYNKNNKNNKQKTKRLI